MKINLRGEHSTQMVWLNGKVLDPKKSQKHQNHSPDGFNWGYGGSGPAQLALAICLEIYGSPNGYQDFKFKYIAALPQSDFDCQLDIPDKKTVTLFKDNLISGRYEMPEAELQEKFSEWLRGQDHDWLNYYHSQLELAFIGKGGLESVIDHKDVDQLKTTLKDIKWAYLNSIKA